jgi:SAM-dependent methyltransferase
VSLEGPSYWSTYLDPPPEISRYAHGGIVVDIGCGSGEQLSDIGAAGCRPIGLEPFAETAGAAKALGYPIVVARAEQLPFRTGGVQGILCKVVMPYTDEQLAVSEMGRILAPGGIVLLSLHGLGFYLRYLLRPDEWRHAAYAARTIANTLAYRITGRRLPGFLGDTIFQSDRRMRRYYRASGLTVRTEVHSRKFLGRRVFFGHVLAK